MNHFYRNRRLYAFLAAFFVAAALLLGGLFITAYTEHDCIGDGCAVCAELENCITVLHTLTVWMAAAAAAGLGLLALFRLPFSYQAGRFLRPVSLVTLKIRLND